MSVDNITQTITTIPMAGKRGIDVHTVFVSKQEAFQDTLTEVFVGQINTLRTQLNTFVEQLNITAIQINTDAEIATNAAEIATAKNDEIKNISVGSTITAVPSTPASVTYNPLTGKFTFVIPRGEAFNVNARGVIADRSLYDSRVQGFGFLALDESKIYFKMSNTDGDWSVGLPFGKGDSGIGIVSTVFTSTTDSSGLAGQSGGTDTYTITYTDSTTDTFTVYNGLNAEDASALVFEPDGDITATNVQLAIQEVRDITNLKLDTKLPLTGGTMMGAIIGIQEKAVVLTGNNIDLLKGNVFIKTITSPTTFTISNVATTANTTNSFILELTNAGSYSIGFWSAIKWPNGVIPTFTAVGTDIIGFYSNNNGVTWRGVPISKDSK